MPPVELAPVDAVEVTIVVEQLDRCAEGVEIVEETGPTLLVDKTILVSGQVDPADASHPLAYRVTFMAPWRLPPEDRLRRQ